MAPRGPTSSDSSHQIHHDVTPPTVLLLLLLVLVLQKVRSFLPRSIDVRFSMKLNSTREKRGRPIVHQPTTLLPFFFLATPLSWINFRRERIEREEEGSLAKLSMQLGTRPNFSDNFSYRYSFLYSSLLSLSWRGWILLTRNQSIDCSFSIRYSFLLSLSIFEDNFFSRLRFLFLFLFSFFSLPPLYHYPYGYRISDGIKFDTYNGLASSKSRAWNEKHIQSVAKFFYILFLWFTRVRLIVLCEQFFFLLISFREGKEEGAWNRSVDISILFSFFEIKFRNDDARLERNFKRIKYSNFNALLP